MFTTKYLTVCSKCPFDWKQSFQGSPGPPGENGPPGPTGKRVCIYTGNIIFQKETDNKLFFADK